MKKTLFSFIVLGIKKSNLNKMGELFLDGLEQSLLIEDIPVEIIQKIMLEYASFELTKTDSNKMLGHMNDLVSLYSHIIYGRGGLKYCDVSKIMMRVNRTPQRTFKWHDSISVVRALFGLEMA